MIGGGVVIGLTLLAGGFAGFEDPSELPPLLDPAPFVSEIEILEYSRSDGGRTEMRVRSVARAAPHPESTDSTGRTGSAEGDGRSEVLRLVRHDRLGTETRAAHAAVRAEAPFALLDASWSMIGSEATRGTELRRDPDDPASWLHRWTWSGASGPGGGEERWSRDPVALPQLSLAFRAVRWGLGFRFMLPVVWGSLDLEGEPEGLLRSHVLCTGRETIEVGDTRTTCWRIVVEAQGRTGPLRTVYWIAAAGPCTIVRLDEVDGTRLELLERSVTPSGNSQSGGSRRRGSEPTVSPHEPDVPTPGETDDSDPPMSEKDRR